MKNFKLHVFNVTYVLSLVITTLIPATSVQAQAMTFAPITEGDRINGIASYEGNKIVTGQYTVYDTGVSANTLYLHEGNATRRISYNPEGHDSGGIIRGTKVAFIRQYHDQRPSQIHLYDTVTDSTVQLTSSSSYKSNLDFRNNRITWQEDGTGGLEGTIEVWA